jgi:SAM-dependent methyltransferase
MKRRSSLTVSGSPEAYIIPVLQKETQSALLALRELLPPGAVVLDIGCGNQPLRATIEECGWIYKSLDVAQNDFQNVNFIARIDSEFTIDEKFDLLVCTEVLEHVLRWEKAFENFGKLCKAKAKVLITTPFFFPLHEAPHDYWRPTPYAIQSFASLYNFSVLKQVSAGSPWDALGTLLNSTYLTSSDDGFFKKLKAWLLLKFISYLKKQLLDRKITDVLKVEGSWYLSNIVLLQYK